MSALKATSLSFTVSDITSAVKTYNLSKSYVQKLIRVSLLNILYRRLKINETNFYARKAGDVPYVLFRPDSKDPIIKMYHAWSKGLVDAISRNYLKEVTLLFRNSEQENEILECYKFSIKYNTTNTEIHNRTEVKEVTINLLKVLLHLGKNERLGKNVKPDLVFKYHSITPDEYEPPHFTATDKPECDKIEFPYLLGGVNTGFHKVTCRAGGQGFNMNTSIEGSQRDMSAVEAEEQPQNNQDSEGFDVNMDTQNAECVDTEERLEINTDNTDTPETPQVPRKKRKASGPLKRTESGASDNSSKKKRLDESFVNITISDEFEITNNETNDIMERASWASDPSDVQITSEAVNISCICKMRVPSEYPVIMCRICGRRYHMYCHGYITEETFKTSVFRCVKCGTTDDILRNTKTGKEYMNVARFRLVVATVFNKQDHKSLLNSMDEKSKLHLIEKIDSVGILRGPDNLMSIINATFKCNNSQLLTI